MDMSRLIFRLAIPAVSPALMYLKRLTEAECSTVQKGVWHQLKILLLVSGCSMEKERRVLGRLQVVWNGGQQALMSLRNVRAGLTIYSRLQKMERLKIFRAMIPG